MKKIIFAPLVLLWILILTVPSSSVTEKWVAGVVNSLTPLCSTEINSLVSLNAIQCTVVVPNSTNKDLYLFVSVSLGSVASGSASPYAGIYIYYLNQDGSTYGDGLYSGTAAAGPPASNYMGCSIPAPPGVTATINGSCYIAIEPRDFVIVFYNNLLVNMASGSNTVKYLTFNRQAN